MLQKENKFLVDKAINIEEELKEVKDEWESKRDSIETNIISLK